MVQRICGSLSPKFSCCYSDVIFEVQHPCRLIDIICDHCWAERKLGLKSIARVKRQFSFLLSAAMDQKQHVAKTYIISKQQYWSYDVRFVTPTKNKNKTKGNRILSSVPALGLGRVKIQN